jgi:hypothetical protein
VLRAELSRAGIVDQGADQVCRQQVRGKLNALKSRVDA